jgi:hypothetical protein
MKPGMLHCTGARGGRCQHQQHNDDRAHEVRRAGFKEPAVRRVSPAMVMGPV